MILAVASGKGGTGKTLVSVNLAKVIGNGVHLLDCDVEEPNDHLFVKGDLCGEVPVTIPVPKIDESLCDGCGECANICEFNAIVTFGSVPIFFPDLCHGCGGCAKVCPKNAISEVPKRIGIIQTTISDCVTLTQGRLDVGSPMATPLIRELRRRQDLDSLNILDAPPGTSCPVIATIRGADYILLITEPTPFGLHDLKLAVEMVRTLQIPFGVVINRMGIGDDRVHNFCHEDHIPILIEIPDDRRIAETYSKGHLIVDDLPEYRPVFDSLSEITLSHATARNE